MQILGIDPGLTGGVGLLDNQARYVSAHIMECKAKSRTKREIDGAWLASYIKAMLLTEPSTLELVAKPTGIVVLERQRPFPGQGVSSVFSLADSCGTVRGICAALGLVLEYVEPQVWKRWYGLPGKDKELARSKAINLYPQAPLSRKKDHGVAEALLIARWYALHGQNNSS